MVFATLYVSPKIAVPSKATINKLRIRPVILETIVPTAITEVARNSWLSDILFPPNSAPTLHHSSDN